MSNWKLWKEQTRWRLFTAVNNNKKYQWFFFKTLNENWKTFNRHVYCRLNKIIKLLFTSFKTSSLFCRPILTYNVIRLLFFLSDLAIKKLISLFLLDWPSPFEKSALMCWLWPMQVSTLHMKHNWLGAISAAWAVDDTILASLSLAGFCNCLTIFSLFQNYRILYWWN